MARNGQIWEILRRFFVIIKNDLISSENNEEDGLEHIFETNCFKPLQLYSF